MANSEEKKSKNGQLKKMLIIIWVLFLGVMAVFGIYVYKKKDKVADDLGMTTRFSYQTNANQDINALIITYLNALASSDQDILKACVTKPDVFNDMANIQSQSKIITSYSNINCYTVEGLDENSTLVYAVANISITGIEVTPLDMLGPFYVVKKDGHYLIDNGQLSDEVNKFISKANKDNDIQELYQMVKDDEDAKAAQDPAFKDFLDKLNQ